MAPRLRPKPNTHARMQRVATQFTELEVTPNRPGEKSHHPTSTEDNTSRLSQMKADAYISSAQEATTSILGENQQPVKHFSWSDAGSTANNTRRSSPADLGEISSSDMWELEESLAPFSSPNSEKNKLPDTMPLVGTTQPEQTVTPEKHVDLSETASTIRRSSPFATSDGARDIWNFDDSPQSNSPSRDISKDVPVSPSTHLPLDELYDSTPRKSVVSTQTAVKLNGNEPTTSRDIQARPAKVPLQPKAKKSRQRAKEPIKFDPLTQEIVAASGTKKKKVVAARLPIVSALQESANASSSPVAVSQKPKPKRSRPQKKVKPPEMRPAPDNPPPSRGKDSAAFIDSPARPVVESPSECLQDLPSAGHRDNVEANLSVSGGDVFDPTQAPKRQHYPPPPAVDDLDGGPGYETETLPTERGKPKKRKLSRQFSVSERGSPVVVMDAAPHQKLDRILPQPEQIQPRSPEQLPAVKSSSFLRSTSNDRPVEQQHGSVFKDIEGRSSSQWLRRVSDKQPAPEGISSMGKKLHDEIMKSFLGHSGIAQEPNGSNPPCATLPNHVENQMRWTFDQLISRLDEKKTAAVNIADVYRKSGKDSVANLKQQCLQDSNSLAGTFRKDSGLFGKTLRAATAAIEDRSLARTKTAVELDNVMESRRQAYGRARQSLRTMRDELTRERGMML